jgi:hypothetical protein
MDNLMDSSSSEHSDAGVAVPAEGALEEVEEAAAEVVVAGGAMELVDGSLASRGKIGFFGRKIHTILDCTVYQ